MLAPSAALFIWAKASRPPPEFRQSLFHVLATRWRPLARRPIVADVPLPGGRNRHVRAPWAKIHPGLRTRADYPMLRRAA